MNTKRSAAFSLIEVSLALGIVAFCIPSIVGLLSVGMSNNQISSEQIVGTGILTAVSSDLRATPAASASSQQFNIAIPASTEEQKETIYLTQEGKIVATALDAYFLVTVTFLSSNNVVGDNSTLANVKVSWPAKASASARGAVEMFVALNRN
ncbi:MAG: hypothetical protein ACFUZC_03940 [Chthoniobacteraceae bacterium]